MIRFRRKSELVQRINALNEENDALVESARVIADKQQQRLAKHLEVKAGLYRQLDEAAAAVRALRQELDGKQREVDRALAEVKNIHATLAVGHGGGTDRQVPAGGGDVTLDLDAMKARIDKAHQHVGALCMGETRWTMHIPVDPLRDSDMIITEGLCDADRLMDEVKRQRVRIEDLEHELRLARQHLDVCDRWQAVEDHDRDQAASNR